MLDSDVNIPPGITCLAIEAMPSIETDHSRDGERRLKHQHSGSIDYGKAMVPMWDSSDPDRAPPPLPLNPSSPNVASRPNTSSAIQSAHAALTERARENALVSNTVARRIETSPERSLIKGATHKRMQSLQSGHVRDLSNFIEGGLSPTKSPEKIPQQTTPQDKKKEEEPTWMSRSPEKEPARSVTPTPTSRGENLNMRPSLRRPQQSILGENTPPQSATMLALQFMSSRDVNESRESRDGDSPLANVTNGSTAVVRAPQTFDAISNQILSLTSIATSLQREMAQLNRRSKDNATDLVSLKEATNSRDEDIRKSLRDLTSNLSKPASQSPYALRSSEAYLLDDKPHTPLSRGMKTISLPRIPSPTSFSATIDRAAAGTPNSSYNPDGGATIALLEKVLREMGTKEGQELLVSRLAEIAKLLTHDGMETAKKIEDVLKFIKQNSGSRALVVNDSGGNNSNRPRNLSFDEPGNSELDFDSRRSGPMLSRVENLLGSGANKENGNPRAADIINEDVLKIIKTIKDSVAQGGGLTAEVKALVRELRGEVLGMGREIGRKLEQAAANSDSASAKDAAAETEQVARIINDGLQDLKKHLDGVMREARRQSASSMASRNNLDGQDVYNAVKSALTDTPSSGLAKEEVIDAVKEAWENYKPDIEVQHFGLERDEMLACLKEGIQEYMPRDLNRDVGATREEVFVAVVEGMKHFSPPRVETEASISRDEILDAVRECLEEFEFPSAPAPELRDVEITRDDVLDAVIEGLSTFEFPSAPGPEIKNAEITKHDVLEAVMEGLSTFELPPMESRSTEITKGDVLDAIMEGLSTFELPAAPPMEPRNVDSTREDMLDAVMQGLSTFELPTSSALELRNAEITKEDVRDAVMESLSTFEFPSTSARELRDAEITKDDILDAVMQGLSTFELPSSSAMELRNAEITKGDVLDAVMEGLSTFELPPAPLVEPRNGEITREDVLDAVMEGLSTFELPRSSPMELRNAEITKEDVREAVMESLNNFEGPSTATRELRNAEITKEDVREAVMESLSTFELPRSSPMELRNAEITKDDVREAVMESLSTFDFPSTSAMELRNAEITKDDVREALMESLSTFEFPSTSTRELRNVEITKEDVREAVMESLSTFERPSTSAMELRNAEITREDVLDAVMQGLSTFELPSVAPVEPRNIEINREDMLHAVMEGLNAFEFPIQATQGNELSRDVGGSLTKHDVFDAVKAGLEDMPGATDAHGDQILERLHEVLESMRIEFRVVSDEAKQNVSAHGRDTEQVLDATKDGFEKLRVDIETYVDRAADITGKDEILECVKESFEGLRAEIALMMSHGSDISAESVKYELNNFREAMATSLVPAGAGVNGEEILSTIRDGLEELRADIERPRDVNESVLSGTGEILDAFHDGLNGLKGEVERIGSKPVDMTVNYEILDTLKAGMEALRGDIDRLRESGFQDNHSSNGDREIATITNGPAITTEGLKRDDIENLEVLITQLRVKVEALENMPPPAPMTPPGSVCKDDIVHMEETLRLVQESVAEISGSHRSGDGESVRREDFEAIETLLRNTKAKIDDLDPEQAVKKDHLDAVEGIIIQTRDSINEILTHIPETAKREDVNIVEALVKDVMVMLQDVKDVSENDGNIGVIVLGVKDQIDKMITTDLAGLASKEELTNLGEIVKGLKEANNTAFGERQTEIVGVGERVSEVKTLLEQFRDTIKAKLEEGTTGVDSISKVLEGLAPTISSNANITKDVKDLLETMKSEFEKSNAGMVGVKLDGDEKFEKTWGKIDEKFEELLLKYDDAQLAAGAKEKAVEERNAATDAALLGTKALAEELKLIIDTLGSTLTDSVEKMDEASKTVFNRVEDTYTKLEETHTEVKTEGQLTREQVLKTLCAVEDVQSNVTDYQPKLLDSIKDVLLIVGQHYEHSKTSTDTIQETIKEHEAASITSVQGLLQNVPDKYDDFRVHEKLDKLVDHMQAAGKSFAQLDMLDEIHRKVLQTAAEVSEFVSIQTLRITNDHDDKVKEAEEAAILLERRLAEKERVEADIARESAEEQRLKDSVAALKAEQQGLAHQKMRLSADVSSLETALRIRREELQDMEARAEGIERRIMEGVIDHSRAFLIGRTKGRDTMNLKRVPSQAASTTGSTMSAASSRSRTTQSAMGMAMNAPPRVTSRHPTTVNSAGASRRNFSLNQITNNIPNGGVKRSHSVKATSGSDAIRKSSWGGSVPRRGYGELNKENLALREGAEESESDVSDTGTLRKVSRGTMSTMTGTDVSGSIDEGTEYSESDGEYDENEENRGLVMYEQPA